MIRVIRHTKNPLTVMGEVASVCWNSKSSPRIGVECMESGHGRILEYADITVEISGYSNRCIRELYTHIVGVSRIQESTRYVDMSNFDYYTPDNVLNNPDAKEIYDNCMINIMKSYVKLKDIGIPREDTANLLPLGSSTKIVLKINARAILNMAENRLCSRALKEYRELMGELINETSKLDCEWAEIMAHAKPKCDIIGYCPEAKSCGKYPNK